MTAADDAVELALWARLEESWTDDAAHAAYLEHCSRVGQLPLAARRYRERRDALPADDQQARARLDQRLGAEALLAMRDIDARRPPREPPAAHPLRKVGVVVVALLLMAAAALLVSRLLG